jgi:hypothetical protein
MEILEQALSAARDFSPMSEQQVRALLERTRQAGLSGKYERFKVSNVFDGTAEKPEWLG